jgi:leucine dehydrogenase
LNRFLVPKVLFGNRDRSITKGRSQAEPGNEKNTKRGGAEIAEDTQRFSPLRFFCLKRDPRNPSILPALPLSASGEGDCGKGGEGHISSPYAVSDNLTESKFYMVTSYKLLNMNPQDLVRWLKEENILRFYFVHDQEKNTIKSSHKILRPLVDFIQSDSRDFNQHEGLFFQVTRKYDILQGVFVHRTNRGQAAGGVRYWMYDSVEEYLRDGMRLAAGMTMKNALAGLWWGGGKGVMAHNPALDKNNPIIRAHIYQEFGELVSSLRGCYVAAEDVGTDVTDMAKIYMRTRFTTCIPAHLGGSGNPATPTARGVISGMEAALEFLGMGNLKGKTVAVQGMGHVAAPLIQYLFEKEVKKVIACDINPHVVKEVRDQLGGRNLEAYVARPGDTSVIQAECDILSPCATGAVLNPDTIPGIRAKIVCGSANNQLQDGVRDDRALFERGIVYVPDFLTNRMGSINSSNEQYGYVRNDPLIEKHLNKEWDFSIFCMTQKVLNESKLKNTPPGQIALAIAEKLSHENHPIFGHRGRLIVDSLVSDNWHEIPLVGLRPDF